MNKIKLIENNTLKKHVSLIHCSNNLSLLQRKISNVLLFHAYPVLNIQEEHKIAISQLCKYIEYRGYNYDAIKQALKSLISTVIEWNIFDDDIQDEDWTASSILASINIKKAICTYAYSPRMKQLLFSPIMYGVINLTIQSKFTSTYSLALYENCSRYRNLKKTKTFSLEQFRKIMGVSNDKYLIFRDFKKRVIDKAVDEINDFSDLTVEVNFIKIGQQVTNLYFSIFEKKNLTLYKHSAICDKKININSENLNEEILYQRDDLLIEKLKNTYFLSKQTINSLVQEYGIDKLKDKVKQIESTQSFLNKNITNIAGFLIDALKKDYMPNQSIKAALENRVIIKEKKDEEAKQLNLKYNKIRTKYDKYIDDQFNDFINQIDKQYLKELFIKFEDFLKVKEYKIVYNRFKENGLNSRLTRVFFKNFLQEHTPEISIKLTTFEQYCDENNLDVRSPNI